MAGWATDFHHALAGVLARLFHLRAAMPAHLRRGRTGIGLLEMGARAIPLHVRIRLFRILSRFPNRADAWVLKNKNSWTGKQSPPQESSLSRFSFFSSASPALRESQVAATIAAVENLLPLSESRSLMLSTFLAIAPPC